MRVLLWNWGRRGGGPRFTLELAQTLMKRRNVEVFLSLSRQSELFDVSAALGLPGCHVDTYSGIASAIIASTQLSTLRRRMADFIDNERIDVVLVTMRHVWTPFLMESLRGRHKTAKVVTIIHDARPHAGDFFPGWQWCFAREFEGSDHLITLTSHVRNDVQARFNLCSDKFHVVPLPSFSFPGVVSAARHLPADRPVRLLFFGRIKPYKGLDLFLEAVRLVQQHQDVEVIVAGAGDVAPFRGQLAAIRSLRLENRWIAEGEVAELLASSDVMVAAHLASSQSGVVPAALGAGLPVVATPVGGLLEQVRPNISGVVADGANAPALAAAIQKLISDPELYATCSLGALALGRGQYSWDRVSESLLGVFGSLLSRSSSTDVAESLIG